MKKVILSLLPEKWINEIYYKGVKDAGAQVVSASYWFSGSGPLFESMYTIGRNLIEYQSTSIDNVRADVYKKYPEVKEIKRKDHISHYEQNNPIPELLGNRNKSHETFIPERIHDPSMITIFGNTFTHTGHGPIGILGDTSKVTFNNNTMTQSLDKVLYTYTAVVTKVVDGDTLDVNISLGFDTWHVHRIRLTSINAESLTDKDPAKKAKAQAAAKYLTDNVMGKTIYYKSTKIEPGNGAHDQYMRYYAELFINATDTVSVNQTMLELGLVNKY